MSVSYLSWTIRQVSSISSTFIFFQTLQKCCWSETKLTLRTTLKYICVEKLVKLHQNIILNNSWFLTHGTISTKFTKRHGKLLKTVIILFVTHPIFFTFKNVFWNFSALMTVAFYVASLKKSVTLQINWEGLLASDEIVLTRESRIFLCWEESRPFLWWNFGPLGIKSSSSSKEARGRGAKGYFWPYQPPWRIWPFCGLCQGKRRSDIFTFHQSFNYAFSSS